MSRRILYRVSFDCIGKTSVYFSAAVPVYIHGGHIDPENECPYIMIQIAVRPLMANGKVTMVAYYTNYIGLSANITN